VTVEARASMPIALRLRGVEKRFGAIQALRGLDLDLQVGEWIGLLGPNGAGKTTLMRIIAGLIPADSGRFELFDQPIDPTRSSRARRTLGVVPQEIALYSALTAVENLRIFARMHGVDRHDLTQRVEWALDWTGVRERAHQPVAEFSGGMRRRLNIACSVLHEPRLVLLDEPTVGVDPQARQRIWRMLESLRAQGTSLIHSSHQLDEIETTCDRVLIMDHGEVVLEGALEELIGGVLGSQRRLVVRFSGIPVAKSFGPGFEVDDHQVRGEASDLGMDIPKVLRIGREQGLEVVDVHVAAPKLEDVFTQMTGQELRE